MKNWSKILMGVLLIAIVVVQVDTWRIRHEIKSYDRAIDTVNVGTTANDGTGDPLRTAFIKINESLYMLDTLGVDDLNATDVLYIRETTSNVQAQLNAKVDTTDTETYSTENYGTTGTGDIVLSIGPTLTTVSITDVIRLTPTASPPAGATEGMIYADTDHHLYYYNGTGWIQLDN